MSTTPMMFEGNDVHMIPEDQIEDAKRNGGVQVQKMLFGQNDTRWIPTDQVDAATKGGGKVMGTSPSAPKPAMKEDTRTSKSILAKGTPLEGVGATLGREYDAAKGLVKSVIPETLGGGGAIYHAATDPLSEEEKTYGTLPDWHGRPKPFEEQIGPTGRLIDRMIVQPTAHAISDYAHGKVSVDSALNALPEAIGQSGATVLMGKATEVGKDVMKGGAPETGAEGPTLPRSEILKRGVGANVPFTDTPLSTAAGQVAGAGANILGKGAKAAAGAAGDAVAKGLQATGEVATKGAIEVGKGAVRAIADEGAKHLESAKKNIISAVEDALPNSSDPVKTVQNILKSSGELGEALADKAAPIAKAIGDKIASGASSLKDSVEDVFHEHYDLVDDLLLRNAKKVGEFVTDKYNELTNPPVGGGAPGIEPSLARQAPGIEPISKAPESPAPLDEPFRQPWKEAGIQQTQDPTVPGSNPIFQAMGEHPEVGRVASPGQLQGGARLTMEQFFRKIPVFGERMRMGIDATQKTAMSKAVNDFAEQLKTDKATRMTGMDIAKRLIPEATDKYGQVDFRALQEALKDVKSDSEAHQSFKRLVDAGAKFQEDWTRTSWKGAPGWASSHAAALAGAIGGFSAFGPLGGAAGYVLGEIGGPKLVDYLMTPDGVATAGKFWTIMTKANPTPSEIKSANNMADQMFKDIQKAERQKVISPKSHQFSKSAWQKANPGATAEKLNQHIEQAKAANYKVVD